MIRTLLVDDEPLGRRGIVQRLHAESDFEIVGECDDGAAAIEAIPELRPDLVFLDLQMPEVNGFDVIEAVGLLQMPPVIFVTAFDQFAVRAFEVHALDYVLKPIEGERFLQALQRARERLVAPVDAVAVRVAAALQELGRPAPRRWAKRLAVKSTGRVQLVDVADIERIEADGNYAQLHAGVKSWLLRETMTSLEARLDPEQFARISRSSIVNLVAVRELRPMFNGDFVAILRDGTQIPGSRRYRAALDRLLAC
jgi:two-component system LytT family response regulator